MDTATRNSSVHDFSVANDGAADPLPRHQPQRSRLQEPAQMLATIDPITGDDIEDLAGRPCLVDGNGIL